jgi:hypothetical protein
VDLLLSFDTLFTVPFLPLFGTLKPDHSERARYPNVFLFQAGAVHECFVTHIIKNICYAIIVEHTWTVVLLFFLFHLPAKGLCDMLLSVGLYSFMFIVGLLLFIWILGNKVQNKIM